MRAENSNNIPCRNRELSETDDRGIARCGFAQFSNSPYYRTRISRHLFKFPSRLDTAPSHLLQLQVEGRNEFVQS